MGKEGNYIFVILFDFFRVKGHVTVCIHSVSLDCFMLGSFLLLGTLAITSVPLFMSFQKMAQPV